MVLFSAVLLWAYISTIKNDRVRYKIPLEYRNLSIKNIVSETSKDSIVVTLDGKRDKLKNIQINNITAFVDLSKSEVGKKTEYPVKIYQRDIPQGIKIVQSTDIVSLLVEKKKRKRIKVLPNITGSVAEGYAVRDIKIKPEYIYITGPSSEVSKIDFLYSEEIHLDDESYSFAKDVSIFQNGMDKISFDEVSAKVFLPIIKYDNLKEIKIPVKVKLIDTRYKYELRNKQVVVYVQIPVDSDFDDDSLIASIDVTNVDFEKLITDDKKSVEMKFNVKIIKSNDFQDIKIISKLPQEVVLKISSRE